MKTYCFKLYNSKRSRRLHRQIDAGLIYNHCIALHKRYYRLYNKPLNIYQLQKHLTNKAKEKSKIFLSQRNWLTGCAGRNPADRQVAHFEAGWLKAG